jgi:hypothetical protein
MSSDFPGPDELRRTFEESKRTTRRRRRAFSQWLNDSRAQRLEWEERERAHQEALQKEIAKKRSLAQTEVSTRAADLRARARRSRSYEHHTTWEMAKYVADAYASQGFKTKISRDYKYEDLDTSWDAATETYTRGFYVPLDTATVLVKW